MRSVAAPRRIVSDLSLGPGRAPPVMTETRAVEAARAAQFTSELLDQRDKSVEYGAFEGRDVWKITIRGVVIPTPGGSSRRLPKRAPPPVTTLVIFIDDKTGRYLHAVGL